MEHKKPFIKYIEDTRCGYKVHILDNSVLQQRQHGLNDWADERERIHCENKNLVDSKIKR